MIERINLGSRDEWLADRLRYINASEIAIVCGESSYGSLAELYAEKKGLRPPMVDSAVLRRGRWGESAVFEALAEQRPEWDIVRAKVHVRDNERRLACTPDGFATAPDRDGIGIIQAKVISRSVFRQYWMGDREDGEVVPPAQYRLQTLTEMMLNETKWGVLAVLVVAEFDWQLELIEIERDPVLEDRIEYHAAAFWRDHLDAGIMPAFEPNRDETLVRALYPKDDGSEIDLTGDNRALALVEDLISLQAALKRLQKNEAAMKTELCGKLGEHTTGRLADGRRISWRTQNRKGYTVEPSSFRVFRILEAKGDA
jgi:predicted phage-related endonuclease